MKRWLSLALLLSLAAGSLSALDNWTNWRGPKFTGAAVGKDYPTSWSKTENVKWSVTLPGPGASTPIIWQDKIFLTCGINGKNGVVCLDRTGKTLWQQELDAEEAGKHKKATGSNPSIVTDGQHLWAYFKSGTLACLDFQGKIVWQKPQKIFTDKSLWWDMGNSPILTKDHVIITVMHSGPSYLAAFEKATGKEAWKVERATEAPSEAAQSYSTPIQIKHNDQDQLIILGADWVTAHDAATGKEIWRVTDLNPKGEKFFRSIASPVVTGGMVVAPYSRGNVLTGIKLGGQGDVTNSHVSWRRNGIGTDVPTPAGAGDRAYLLTDKGDLNCLDVLTGKTLWTGTLEKNRNAFSASPVLVEGKVYCIREDGKAFIAAAGNDFQLLGTAELGDELVVATPVFVDSQIFIRTKERLYCIGK